jgi:hypothetical protein
MVIIAAACLHNFVIHLDGLDALEENDIVEDSDEDDSDHIINEPISGQIKRNRIVSML